MTDGGTSNSATVDATPVYGPTVIGVPTPISDVSDDGDDLDGNTTDDPTEYAIAPSLAPTGLTVRKTTASGIVARGDTVAWTITIRNRNPVVSGSLDIVDALPAGFLYVPGSATFEGAAWPVTVAGRVVTWPNVPVPPLTTVTATLSSRVTAGAASGEHVNTATIRNPATGALMARAGTATVRILPEAVFDCADVVGRVFDDRNANGYQDDPGPPPIVDDDALFAGKYGKLDRPTAAEALPWTEAGLPGARLIGVDGTSITTDAFGRFHVPCAMLPASGGGNFILKLDPSSLPAGFLITTENPRVVRLTAGKMTEINFGATLPQTVAIDLADSAFAAGSEPSDALLDGIDAVLSQLDGRPARFRLSYRLHDGTQATPAGVAQQRLEEVARAIRERWQGPPATLDIQETIYRVAE